MARAATDEQGDLKRRARRRLIGAIALVTVIAVVLPWVLEREPRESSQEVSIQIPSSESGAFKSRVAEGKAGEPKKPEASGAAPAAVEAKPAEAPPAADALKSEQDKLLAPPAPKAAAPAPKAAAKDKPVAEAKKPADPAADKKQYVVQVAALADADKAAGIQKELANKGIKAYTEVVKTASGDVTRVRVGPLANREAAEKERARLKSLGYEGNVAPR